MTEQAVVQWVTDYGYFGIFFLLIFGIIGLPIPDEWLLVISGYLAFKNVLGFFPTVAVAAIGSAGGLTVSYVLGRTCSRYLVRYGGWLSIDGEKIVRAQKRFHKLGRWVLVVGPFIPGVRNLMGYIAGASKLHMHVFIRFAYLGALISSATFVTFGYFVGRHVIRWNYSTLPLVAVALAVAFTASGLPFRMVFWIKNKMAAAAAKNAIRLTEASAQPACTPKK